MTMIAPARLPLNAVDGDRLRTMVALVRRHDGRSALEQVLPAGSPLVDDIERHCEFSHAALLVFPERLHDAVAALRMAGCVPRDPIPSTVVQDRLRRRYGTVAGDLRVWIVRGELCSMDGVTRTVEVFVAPRGQDARPAEVLIARERSCEHEMHFAFTVRDPDLVVLSGLRDVLCHSCGFSPDGGGFNPYEHPEHGGQTVLYFIRRAPGRIRPVLPRVELELPGRHESLLRRHLSVG